MTCAMDDKIKIFRGDDTNWNGQNLLNFQVTSEVVDLSDMTARFSVGEIVYDNISLANEGRFSINFTHDQTARMPFGSNCGVIQILDSAGRIKTITNSIELYVTNTLFEDQAQTLTIGVAEGATVDILLQAGIRYATYVQLQSEVSARQAADQVLQDNITTCSNNLTSHASNTSNPHQVTKAQLGLSNVNNTSDADKPISTAVQAALDQKQAAGDYATQTALYTGLATKASNADGTTIVDNGTNISTVAVKEQRADTPIKPWVGNTAQLPSTKDSNTIYVVTDEDDSALLSVDSALSSSSENPVQNKVIYTALQGKQDVSNLVTSVSSASTDSQYPSAKLFYDTCGDIETLINAL